MRNPLFKIAASSAMKRRYRDLLEDEFSESSLEECLTLFRQLVETSGYRLSFEWEVQNPRKHNLPYPIPEAAEDYLKDYLERTNARLSAEMPEQVPARTALERRTWTAGVFLTFQTRVRLEGDTGFARDVQSFMYQLCLHVLSPKLRNKGLADADGFLLNTLYAHAMNAWTDRPEHQTYLLGMLYEHTGQIEEATAQLRAAINNSSPDDHDFVTKAQAYWSLLLEANRVDEAKAFLLHICRRAAEKDLPEMQELFDDTYAFETSTKKAS